MRAIDLRFQGRERVISAWEHDGLLFDPGPESTLPALLEGLGDTVPQAILLSHIHFDHAGATGALVRRWPHLTVHVHDRGARHMASPERLLASTARLIGEDGVRRRWGGMAPVPEERLRVLQGGEELFHAALRVAYTPGHAIHHVAYLHAGEGWAMCGDVAGVRIPPEDVVIAPTPPPDVDLRAWGQSLAVVRDWSPERLCLSHFGAVDDVERHLDALEAGTRRQAEHAERLDPGAFAAWYRGDLESRMPSGSADLYIEASPVEHMWRGLARWRERQVRAARA